MMNTAKRRRVTVCTIILIVVATASLSAVDYDFGLNLRNSTAFIKTPQESSAALSQLDSAAAWFELANPISKDGRVSLSGQMAYEYTNERAYLFNLDYFRLSTWVPGLFGAKSVLELNAGRFQFSDASGYIMNHTADGLKIRFIMPSATLALSGAYTGYLLNPKSNVRMTTSDWSEKNDEEANVFGPSRLIADATLSFGDLGKIQNFSVYAIGQFDMRKGGTESTINTQYLGITLTRLHGTNLYGNFLFNAEYGQLITPNEDDRQVVGFMTGWNLKYIREDWKGSRFNFTLLAAPPDFSTDLIPGIEVGLVGYLPVNQPNLGINVSPQMNSLGLAELTYSIRPFMDSANGSASRLQAEIGGRMYFRTWTVQLNWIETDPASDSFYVGSEIEGGFQWRIFSDVGMGFNGSAFIPSVSPFGAVIKDMDPLWTVRLDVSISL